MPASIREWKNIFGYSYGSGHQEFLYVKGFSEHNFEWLNFILRFVQIMHIMFFFYINKFTSLNIFRAYKGSVVCSRQVRIFFIPSRTAGSCDENPLWSVKNIWRLMAYLYVF